MSDDDEKTPEELAEIALEDFSRALEEVDDSEQAAAIVRSGVNALHLATMVMKGGTQVFLDAVGAELAPEGWSLVRTDKLT